MTVALLNDAQELYGLVPKISSPKAQGWNCFSTPEAMIAHLRSVPLSRHWHYKREADTDDKDPFCGGLSLADAFAHVEQGWPAGAERVARLRDKIMVQRPHGLRLVKWDMAGAYCSVPRALAGNPLNMRRLDSTRLRKRPIVTLVNHMGGASWVNADCFVNRAAVVAALVDAIESSGYSCHVVGVAVSENNANKYLHGTLITLKEPQEAVDITRMAFTLGHVAFFRRCVFSLRSSDKRHSELGSGLGLTRDFPKSEDANAQQQVYILPSLRDTYAHFETEALAETQGLAFFTKHLTELGCPGFVQL